MLLYCIVLCGTVSVMLRAAVKTLAVALRGCLHGTEKMKTRKHIT